ncbi:hypothetical protein M011DRAFT_484695 [Sporormia fimetaria CBS 119925]|uniref:Uncharacterized protein n=1 Tax=Sporormia fimetaria CBS 119925 TaxID=1340428 RepID=A0A6A6VHH0_9PLEO|nr:hypothetical protein M011DRAFT_484695 [Sporormia fimetaria CBS 119925]
MTTPDIWSLMNYAVPRGECQHGKGMFNYGKCPCKRFMLHPLKSASTFDCDGCGHHASFHLLENPQEETIRKRWETEANATSDAVDTQSERPRKRLREISYGNASFADITSRLLSGGIDGAGSMEQAGSSTSSTMERAKEPIRTGKSGNTAKTRSAKGKQGTVLAVDHDDVLELD